MLSRLRHLIRQRWKLISILDLLFFGCLTAAVVSAEIESLAPVSSGWHPNVLESLSGAGWIGTTIGIVVFQLLFGGFLVASLSGMLLFPLPVGILAYHAFCLGLILWAVPSSMFWPLMLAFFLEGEAFVLGALGGILVGISWMMPSLLYGRERYSRKETLVKSLTDSACFYLLAITLLIAAAVVEALS